MLNLHPHRSSSSERIRICRQFPAMIRRGERNYFRLQQKIFSHIGAGARLRRIDHLPRTSRLGAQSQLMNRIQKIFSGLKNISGTAPARAGGAGERGVM